MKLSEILCNPCYVLAAATSAGAVALAGKAEQVECHEADVVSAGGQFFPLVVEMLGYWTPSSLKTLKIIASKTTSCNITSLSRAFSNLMQYSGYLSIGYCMIRVLCGFYKQPYSTLIIQITNLYHGHVTCGQEEHAILIYNFHGHDAQWTQTTSFSPRPRDLEGKRQMTT